MSERAGARFRLHCLWPRLHTRRLVGALTVRCANGQPPPLQPRAIFAPRGTFAPVRPVKIVNRAKRVKAKLIFVGTFGATTVYRHFTVVEFPALSRPVRV